MRSVFVDTDFLVALRDAAELEHDSARETLRDLLADGIGLFTSNHVFAESYTALLVRVWRHESIAWGSAFRASTRIELVRIDPELEDRAWSILASHDDKRWSYVDATSFALMEREGTDEAFAYDADFRQRGLRTHPTSAGPSSSAR